MITNQLNMTLFHALHYEFQNNSYRFPSTKKGTFLGAGIDMIVSFI